MQRRGVGCVVAIVTVFAVTLGAVGVQAEARPARAFASLSAGHQEIALALYEAQRTDGGVTPLTLEEIAAKKKAGLGWVELFEEMKALGLVTGNNFRDLVRQYKWRQRARANGGASTGVSTSVLPASPAPAPPAQPAPPPPAPAPDPSPTVSVNSLAATEAASTLPPSTTFSLNQRVRTTTTANVRSAPSASASVLGSQPERSPGTVVGGPVAASGAIWWRIDYDDGADGWSAEHLLARVVSAPPAAPVPAGQVEKWGMHEIALNATRRYENPFRDVVLTATFRHTSGRSHTVYGFYDGDGRGGQDGSVWKVRFMPTETGTWTWTTSASPADPGLDGKSGSLVALTPGPGNHGPLVKAREPYLHLPHADGTYTFLIGVWARPWESDAATRRAYFDLLREQRLTRIRAWLPESAKFDGDYSRYNLGFFHAVDTTIGEAQSRGIVVDLMLYNNDDEHNMTPDQDRQYIRYIVARYGAFRSVTATISNQVDWHYGAHDSSMADIAASNEWGNVTGQYLQSINTFGMLATQHNPGENHKGLTYYFDALPGWPFASWSDWIVKQIQVTALSAAETIQGVVEPRSCVLNERGLARLNSIVQSLRSRFGQAVSVDEYSFENAGECQPSWWALSSTGTRKTHWVLTAAGAFGTTAVVGGHDPIDVKTLRQRPTVRQLGIIAATMSSLPFWEMVPMNGIVSANDVSIGGGQWRTNFALGSRGTAYLVYSLNGGTGTISLPSGTYNVIRVDPRTGEQVSLGQVSGGTVPFSLPSTRPSDHNGGDGSDWVLLYVHTELRPH